MGGIDVSETFLVFNVWVIRQARAVFTHMKIYRRFRAAYLYLYWVGFDIKQYEFFRMPYQPCHEASVYIWPCRAFGMKTVLPALMTKFCRELRSNLNVPHSNS